MDALRTLSKHFFVPLWELKDGTRKLAILDELTKSEWLSLPAIITAQTQRLIDLLNYVANHVPYYQNIFGSAGVSGKPPDLESFRHLPLITKETIRQNLDHLISKAFTRSELITAKTGGSTGKPLQVYFDGPCQQARNAAAFRSDRWAGWDLGMKTGALWGNPPQYPSLRSNLRRLLLERTFYLDTMNLNENTMAEFVERWRRERAEALFGHAHSLYLLARFVLEREITSIRPRAIISTSMSLVAPERTAIEAAFQCPATNRYGCEEVGLIASECEQRQGMHLNIDHLYVEFLKEDGTAARPGEEGRIVVTDLVNRGMPLIRYCVEDVGVPSERVCPCGRGLPVMERVSGRVADFLLKQDGSRVAGISLVERTWTAVPGIAQMQLVQDRLDEILINLVKGAEWNEESELQLRRALGDVFGQGVKLQIRPVNSIPPEPSGKFRLAVCRL